MKLCNIIGAARNLGTTYDSLKRPVIKRQADTQNISYQNASRSGALYRGKAKAQILEILIFFWYSCVDLENMDKKNGNDRPTGSSSTAVN